MVHRAVSSRPPSLGLAPVRKMLPRSRKGSVMVTVSAHILYSFIRFCRREGHLKSRACACMIEVDRSNRVYILELEHQGTILETTINSLSSLL